KPEIFLLMAIWIKKDGTDEVGFLKTAATAVTTAHWYECIGAGTDIGDYIASRFYSQLMTVKEAVALSIHLLRQVKDYALYCGKSSHIWVLARDGSYDLYASTKVVRAEQYFDDFGHAEQDLIFSAYGSALNDEEFEEKLQNF